MLTLAPGSQRGAVTIQQPGPDKLTFYLCENELLLRHRMETPGLDGMEGEKSPVWHSVFVNYV